MQASKAKAYENQWRQGAPYLSSQAVKRVNKPGTSVSRWLFIMLIVAGIVANHI